ncbi:MAG: CPBP family glutamic-type intramembrane protease [Planctomycetota bacterium]|jgi:membrane protease YdiL (CAAX protease family)
MREPGTDGSETWPRFAEGMTAAAGVCIFGLFVHLGPPLVLVSAGALVVAALVIQRSARKESSWAAVFGASGMSRRAAAITGLACAVGLAFGLCYRQSCDWSILPRTVGIFAPVACLIGAAEEIVYRGYVQGRFRPLGAFPAVVFAAACHTAYKCALFALPATPVETDLVVMATATLLGGVVFGALREWAGSVVPPLAAHACFDLVLYGDLARAPWWVWS